MFPSPPHLHLFEILLITCCIVVCLSQQDPAVPTPLPASVPRINVGPRLSLVSARHGPFLITSTDTFVSRSLSLYGEWCESETKLFFSLVPIGSLVIDVGANIGAFTVPLAKHVGPNGCVLAFEPQRPLFHLLNANAALNELTNAYLYHHAVGYEPGAINVPRVNYTQPGNFGGVSLLPESSWHTRGGVDVVEVITLDSYKARLSSCPTFIKVDVEGMELDVLKGARGILEECRPIVHVENNCKKGSEELVRFLRSITQISLDDEKPQSTNSYTLFWDVHTYYNPENYFNNQEDVFTEAVLSMNILAIPDEQLARIELVRSKNMVELQENKFLLEDYVFNYKGEDMVIKQLGTLEYCKR